jgi:hypothetical protein
MPWILREKSKQTIDDNENHEFIYEFIWTMIFNLQKNLSISFDLYKQFDYD